MASTNGHPDAADVEVAVDFDVAVVGLGPVGAVLAGLLGRRGVRVVVLEREWEVFPLPRAAHIDHTGLRTLQELGVLDDVMPEMLRNAGLEFWAADRSLLFRVPADQPSVSGLPTSMYFHQPGFDATLRKSLGDLPNVEVRLGRTVAAIRELAYGVEIEATVAGCTDPEPVNARWLIGCDGASSAVRELAGIGLDDLDFDENWLVVDVVLREPTDTLPQCAVTLCDPARPIFAIPIPDGRYRFELMLLPDDDPQQVKDRVLDLLGDWIDPASVEVERAAIYAFHALLATDWRAGRVLLAGDAAHQMPPFLGQGMCSGLRDAANLAWKLEQVLLGADEALLDTYGVERAPHVREIVDAVLDFGRVICELDPRAAAARDTRLLSGTASDLMRRSFRLPPISASAVTIEGGGSLFPQPAGVRGVPLLDDRVGSRFLVLGRTRADLDETAVWWSEELGALVTTVDAVTDPSGTLTRWFRDRGVRVAVVRPDRYVLAAGAELAPITRAVRPVLGRRPAWPRPFPVHTTTTSS
jgi:3-(3-hydroxy-phenyl)propionate hydroxylase